MVDSSDRHCDISTSLYLCWPNSCECFLIFVTSSSGWESRALCLPCSADSLEKQQGYVWGRVNESGFKWTFVNWTQTYYNLVPRAFSPHNLKFSTGKSPGNEVDAINLTNQNTRQTFMWADQISWQSQGVDAKLCYCRYQADSIVAGRSRGFSWQI